MMVDFKRKLKSYGISIVIVVLIGVGKVSAKFNYSFADILVELSTSIFDDEDLTTCELQIVDKDKKDTKKQKTEPATNQIKDRDGDGVPDDVDLCPDIPGSVNAQGCPDGDNDGVPDFMDECPDVPGLPEFKGCPDSDGDGIPDHKDNCPYDKGPASNNGCPVASKDRVPIIINSETSQNVAEIKVIAPRKDVFEQSVQIVANNDNSYYVELSKRLEREQQEAKNHNLNNSSGSHTYYLASENEPNKKITDTDGDGITDDKDKCPTEPGPRVNDGCPVKIDYKGWKVSKRDIILSSDEIKILDNIFQNLKFAKGRNIIEPASFENLAQFANLLNKKYSWTVILHCHTNEAQNSFRNQQLSENRGEAIRSYLMSKGIEYSRIKIKGHGDMSPVPNIKANRIEVEITR